MPKSIASVDSSVHPANDRSDDEYEDSDSDDEEYALAQKEWEESMQQLSQVFSIILLPYLGKWLGRRYAHQAYSRYLMYGFGKAFFLGGRPPMCA